MLLRRPRATTDCERQKTDFNVGTFTSTLTSLTSDTERVVRHRALRVFDNPAQRTKALLPFTIGVYLWSVAVPSPNRLRVWVQHGLSSNCTVLVLTQLKSCTEISLRNHFFVGHADCPFIHFWQPPPERQITKRMIPNEMCLLSSMATKWKLDYKGLTVEVNKIKKHINISFTVFSLTQMSLLVLSKKTKCQIIINVASHKGCLVELSTSFRLVCLYLSHSGATGKEHRTSHG